MEHYFKIPFVLLNENDDEVDIYELNTESMYHILSCISDVITLLKEEKNNFDNNFVVFENKKYDKILKNIKKVSLLEDDFDEDDFSIYIQVELNDKLSFSAVQDYLYYIISEILESQFDRVKIFNLLDENLYIDDSFEYSPYNHYCKISFCNLIPSQITEFKY